MKPNTQDKPFIQALSKIFHPILGLLPGSNRSTQPEIVTTVLYPHNHYLSPLTFLQVKFGHNKYTGGLCAVRGGHGWCDDGKLSHIHLRFVAQAGAVTAKFTRIILQVLFRNPDTGEAIEIIDYRPKSTIGSQNASQTYGVQNNMITWDWQYALDPIRNFGFKNYSHRQACDIWINAVRRVKAVFKLVGYYKDGKKEMIRSIPTRHKGMLERYLVLEDAHALDLST